MKRKILGIIALVLPLCSCSSIMHKDSEFIAQDMLMLDNTNTITLVHAKKKSASALNYYIEIPVEYKDTYVQKGDTFMCSYNEDSDTHYLLSSGKKVTNHGWMFKNWLTLQGLDNGGSNND